MRALIAISVQTWQEMLSVLREHEKRTKGRLDFLEECLRDISTLLAHYSAFDEVEVLNEEWFVLCQMIERLEEERVGMRKVQIPSR